MAILLPSIGPMELILVLLIGGCLALWLWALVDCLTKEQDSQERLLWVLLLAVTQVIGAILYLVIRRPRRLAELRR